MRSTSHDWVTEACEILQFICLTVNEPRLRCGKKERRIDRSENSAVCAIGVFAQLVDGARTALILVGTAVGMIRST
jgi:hypothetical protein